jgi:hypothetical protein
LEDKLWEALEAAFENFEEDEAEAIILEMRNFALYGDTENKDMKITQKNDSFDFELVPSKNADLRKKFRKLAKK